MYTNHAIYTKRELLLQSSTESQLLAQFCYTLQSILEDSYGHTKHMEYIYGSYYICCVYNTYLWLVNVPVLVANLILLLSVV